VAINQETRKVAESGMRNEHIHRFSDFGLRCGFGLWMSPAKDAGLRGLGLMGVGLRGLGLRGLGGGWGGGEGVGFFFDRLLDVNSDR
jgi:hypothetical protein